MDLMREAIKRKRSGYGDHLLQEGGPGHMSLHGGEHPPEVGPGHAKEEHEAMDKFGEAPKSPKHVASKTEHEPIDELRDLSPSKKNIATQTEHESGKSAVGFSDDDGDDDSEMVRHMTKDMSDADMHHSMASKPKTLGQRVRQHAVLKASKMGKSNKTEEEEY